MDNSARLSKQKSTIRIVAFVGLLGSIATFVFSMLWGFEDNVTTLQLCSIVLYGFVLIRANKIKRSGVMSLILVIYHMGLIVVMWYEYSLMNYYLSIYILYSIIVVMLLIDEKQKYKALAVKLVLVFAMMMYDVFSYDGNPADNNQYFDIVLGSFIIGLMVILIVEQYSKHLKVLNKKLYDLSVLDPLTGAYNFRLLEETMDACHQEWLCDNCEYTIALIDIDDFKQINDTLGHHKGDELLMEFVQQVKSVVRDQDKVFRYGGDEFTIVFPKMSEVEAKKILERILGKLKETTQVSFSAGVCNAQTCAVRKTNILKLADQKLYYAKQMGKQQIVC